MPTPIEFHEFLLGVARLMPQSFERFVCEHGRPWNAAKRPKGVRKQRDRLCFMNATHLVLNDTSLTYVEGFAFSGLIHTLHAWCVTEDGTVVDPTWKRPEDCLYFGVPFKKEYLMASLMERGFYGLIDDPQNGWPLARGELAPGYFLDPRFPLPTISTEKTDG